MQKVTIVGGGIGGLSAAVALQQRGLHVEVYEAAPALEPIGAGIWMPPNAMQVLERLDLAEAVEVAGLALERVEIWEQDGAPLQAINLDAVTEKLGHTILSIHRAELQNILINRLQPGTLHLGKTCESVSPADGHVVARFGDGTHVHADVLVGADGVHSRIRQQLFPEVTLRPARQTCYLGIAELELPVSLLRTCREVWGGAACFGFSALNHEQVYWFATADADAAPGDHDGADLVKNRLRALYAMFPDPIPDLVAHTEARRIIQTNLSDLPKADRWWKGRVVLLGDAVHAALPRLGQGGAQAVEDAYVLAECLATYETYDEAFKAYERIRMPKAQKIAKRSWQLGKAAHWNSGLAKGLRNAVLRNMPASTYQRHIENLFSLNF